MKEIIFYDKTSLNGRYQVMTTKELTGNGIKLYGTGCILEHKGVIYKNLNRYWVTAKGLDSILNTYQGETEKAVL